jgi:hypothetical protein
VHILAERGYIGSVTTPARAALLSALEEVEPCGLEASAHAASTLIHAIAKLDEEGLKSISEKATVLLLAVFPKQPGEPPKPAGLDKVVRALAAQLRESCAD